MDTKDVVEYFSSNCMKNCTIIYVVASSDMDKTELELRKHLRQVAKQLIEKTIVVYGISTTKVRVRHALRFTIIYSTDIHFCIFKLYGHAKQ